MSRTLTKEELNEKANKELEMLYEKALEGKAEQCLKDLPYLKAMAKAVTDYFYHKNKRELGLEK